MNKNTGDRQATLALADVVEDEKQDRLVRLSAYGAVLAIGGRSGREFQSYEKSLDDVDWEWIRRIRSAAGRLE